MARDVRAGWRPLSGAQKSRTSPPIEDDNQEIFGGVAKLIRKNFFKSSTIVVQVTKVPVGGPSKNRRRIERRIQPQQVVPAQLFELASTGPICLGDEYNER